MKFMTGESSILLVGVGGQGTLVAGRILGEVARGLGLDVKVSEVHGMSQRGGSVVTYVRTGASVHSPLVEPGEADCILAFEQLEGLRWAPYLSEGGVMVLNAMSIRPLTVSTGAAAYPEGIPETLARAAGGRAQILAIDASSLAESSGSRKTLNVVMLGAMAACSGLDRTPFEEAIRSVFPERLQAMNRKAFDAGYAAGCPVPVRIHEPRADEA